MALKSSAGPTGPEPSSGLATGSARSEEPSITRRALLEAVRDYKDKGELFAAVLQRKIDRWLALNETDEEANGSVEDTLLALARRTVWVPMFLIAAYMGSTASNRSSVLARPAAVPLTPVKSHA